MGSVIPTTDQKLGTLQTHSPNKESSSDKAQVLSSRMEIAASTLHLTLLLNIQRGRSTDMLMLCLIMALNGPSLFIQVSA